MGGLVEAEVVQLPLEAAEFARPEELRQDGLEALLRPRDDDAAVVPVDQRRIFREHAVQLHDEVGSFRAAGPQ